MVAKSCTICGAARSASVHSRFFEGGHPWPTAKPKGLGARSEGREAYLASDEHQSAYAEASSPDCAVEAAGAPGACLGGLTPHHVVSRSLAGSLEKADDYPIIMACTRHHEYLHEEGRKWAEEHLWWDEKRRRYYPYLITAKTLRVYK